MPEAKPTARLALLWSFNPSTRWAAPHEMVGSVLAHKGYIETNKAVYWSLIFSPSEEVLEKYDCPISGYLYNSVTGLVEYRARVIGMSSGPREEHLQFVPPWRSADPSCEMVYLLIDQLEEMFPHRPVTDFKYFEKRKKVLGPPGGNYFKVMDPLF